MIKIQKLSSNMMVLATAKVYGHNCKWNSCKGFINYPIIYIYIFIVLFMIVSVFQSYW